MSEIEPSESIHQDQSWVPEWYLGRLSEIEQLRASIKQRYNVLLQDLDKRVDALQYSFGGAFRTESDKLIASARKNKSVKLLTGTVGYRTTPEKVVVADKKALNAWAKENLTDDELVAMGNFDKSKVLAFMAREHLNDCLIDITPGLVHKYIKDTGVLPDGCDIIPAEETFYAKPLQLRLTDGQSDSRPAIDAAARE